MKTVIVNGKSLFVEDGTPLKELLPQTGFIFPCGGFGKCGKCRINCKNLEITNLDKRFLTQNLLNDGVRLACDKTVSQNLTITHECENTTVQKVEKLSECNVAVSIGFSYVEVSILDDKLVETVTLENPLAVYGGFSAIAKAYKKDKGVLTNALRAVIGKESVELFEKYGTAKASNLAIASCGLFLKILFGVDIDDSADFDTLAENDSLSLPTESLYILPVLNNFVGGDILAETIKLKERSLFIDCEKTAVLISLGDNDNLATAMWDLDYDDDITFKAIKAAIKFFSDKLNCSPTIYLYGEHADILEDYLTDAGFDFIPSKKAMENVASACLVHRTRTKLIKEQSRTTYVSLIENELFQKYLSE